MTQKERLVELLSEATKHCDRTAEEVADYLLSNGIVVLPEDDDNLEGIRDYGVGVEPGEIGIEPGEMGCN